MLTLLKSCELYSPEKEEICDILLGGNRILAIGKELFPQKGLITEIVNCSGYKVFPGLIDPLCFPCGDGNDHGREMLFQPTLFADSAKLAGVSSLIGTLGWNDITRSPDTLLRKTKELCGKQIKAYTYTGGFRGNSAVMTGSIASDLTYIAEIKATGAIGIADHRSGLLSEDIVSTTHAEAEAGAELGEKSAVVVYLLGEEKQHYTSQLNILNKMTPVFRHTMLAGVNRNSEALEAGKKFGMKGLVNIAANTSGFFQDDAIEAKTALKEYLRAGVPIKNIIISSYAGIEAVKPQTTNLETQYGMFYSAFCESISDINIPTDVVAKVFSSNASKIFRLNDAGIIKEGMDADILVSTNDFKPVHLFIRGTQVLQDRKVVEE